MKNLFGLGALVGGVLASSSVLLCWATPMLLIAFGTTGLAAWMLNATYVLVPLLLAALALSGVWLYRRLARPSLHLREVSESHRTA
jgi:hypothetical protein